MSFRRTLTFEMLKEADVNGDHSVTMSEIRALELAQQLADKEPQPAKPPAPPGLVPRPNLNGNHKGRYAPWLKKALAKAEHSQKLWKGQDEKRKASTTVTHVVKANKSAAVATSVPAPPSFESIWEAAHAGNVEAVRKFLDSHKVNVFAHHEVDGGKTLLHIACWHGHLELVMFLTMFVQATRGLDALRLFVNAIDTAHSRCTPLLETCRSLKGVINDKLKILKLLVQFGATVEHQDAHGDNALHWSARMHALPIVRFLIKETDAAVFAFISENHKRQKPLDVAKLAKDAKATMCTTEVYEVLRRIYKDCNIRLKIQYGKKMRLQKEAEAKTARSEAIAHALDSARNLIARADRVWMNSHDAAEAVRNELEANVLDESGKEAVGRAQLWLETKDGKAWLKKELPAATEDVKTLVQKGLIPKPRDLKKAAAVRLSESYITGQEADMRDLMKKKFNREHPNLESRDVDYYKRLTMLSR